MIKLTEDLQRDIKHGNLGSIAYHIRVQLQKGLESKLREMGLEDPQVLINYDLILREKADDNFFIEIRDWKEDDSATVLRFETASINIIFKDRMMDVSAEILKNGLDRVPENKQLWAGIHSPTIKEI